MFTSNSYIRGLLEYNVVRFAYKFTNHAIHNPFGSLLKKEFKINPCNPK